jgi:N-acyl-D-amino-acid deacylase
VLANLSEVEGMSLDALRAGVDWGFENFREYLEMLRRKSAYPIGCRIKRDGETPKR